VVVTAERRATDIMSTPISVVAVSGDQLQSAKIVDINSLGQVAPNLQVYTTGTSSTADIRGVGNSNQGGIEEPGVIIVRDGLPNNSEGAGVNAPNYDIADVEVLRGPQGTFAGDNSTSGAIEINSANPNFRGINGYIDVEAATYSEQRGQGAINLPVSDTLALRLAFNEETRGSFFRDLYTQINGPYEGGQYLCPGAYPCIGQSSGQHDGSTGPTYGVSGNKSLYDPGNVNDKDMRLGILWKPSDNWQSLTKIEFDYDDSDGVPSQPNINTFLSLTGKGCPNGEGPTTPAPGGGSQTCFDQYAPGYSGSPYVLNDWGTSQLLWKDDVDMFSEQLQYTGSSGIVYRLTAGDQEVTDDSVSSTSHDTLNVGSIGQTVNRAHIYTGELDVLSPTTGPFSWIAGASKSYTGSQFASFSTNTRAPYSAAAPSHGFYTNGEYITLQNAGIFGQVSWQFTPAWQVVAGVRNGWDSEIALGGLATFRPISASNPTGKPIINSNEPIGGPPSDRVLTGKVDVNWTPAAGQLFYGFVARGYKPGEENLGINPTAHYEYVNDYELGWKGHLANGHVLMQLGGYYMQYMDMIHSIFDPQIPTSTNEGNIPFSILKGIELSLQANAGGFSLNLNGAFNKSILGSFVTAARYKFPQGTQFGITPQCAPGQTPSLTDANGCSDYNGSYGNDPSYYTNLDGESLPYAPEYSGSGTLSYRIHMGDNMSLVPRVGYSYTSKSYSDIFQSDNYYLVRGYSLWSAYLDWNAGAWTTTLYGTNLADTVYQQGLGYYGNPRQLGMEVKYTF